jgi:hypothetical protein
MLIGDMSWYVLMTSEWFIMIHHDSSITGYHRPKSLKSQYSIQLRYSYTMLYRSYTIVQYIIYRDYHKPARKYGDEQRCVHPTSRGWISAFPWLCSRTMENGVPGMVLPAGCCPLPSFVVLWTSLTIEIYRNIWYINHQPQWYYDYIIKLLVWWCPNVCLRPLACRTSARVPSSECRTGPVSSLFMKISWCYFPI